MPLTRRREFLFLYTVKDANPNGDPLNENHPRFDEDTMQAMASDVRIKRTVRDELMRRGYHVFIDAEPKSLRSRFEELKQALGNEDPKEIMRACIDVRLFGVTFALEKTQKVKVAFSWVGPVQFKWARSLHAATFDFVQGTSAFATEDRDKKEDKQQRSFRNEYKVPFALMSVYGIANQYAANETGATDEDVDIMLDALWSGTDNLITRSKNEHKARLLLEVIYKEGFSSKIAALDEKVRLCSADGNPLTTDEEKAIRSLSQVVVDISPLVDAILGKGEDIELVKLIYDHELRLKGEDNLRDFGKLSLETR
ncbi:MAG TPA: type I-B CRISPR-associated protein Cas7/Csh2 [Firmicutes bacterium]|nr:type I-B CRISPR-associated protein Cas7/Csh2 [Bacillota bacterium]